jgi:hypothetical protein
MYQIRGRHNLADYITSVTSLHLINITETSRISLPDDVQRVSKATGCLTSRAHGIMKSKCSGQARLVSEARPVVLGFLQYKNFPETESVSVVRWKRGEKDSNVVCQVGSARPVLRHTIMVVSFLLGYWVASEGELCPKFGDCVVVE